MNIRQMSFISIVIIILIYAGLVNSVKWESKYTSSFKEYELDQAYLLSKVLNKTGFLNTTIVSALIIDEEGYIYSADELPFEWSIMVDNDTTVGAILTDETFDKFNTKSNIYAYKTESDKIKLLIYVKRINEVNPNVQYYLRLKYKVLGITKKVDMIFVEM